MKTCIKTQLKAAVENANLPELNVIYLDYPGVNSSVPDSVIVSLYIKTGSKPVKITLKSAMHINTTSGSTTTQETIAPDTQLNLVEQISNIGRDAISEFVRIEGEGIYDLVKLETGSYTDLALFSGTPTQKNSLRSLKFVNNLIGFGGRNIDYSILPDSLKILAVSNDDNSDINIDNIPTGVQRVDTARITTATQAAQIIELTDATRNLTGLRLVKGRLRGQITLLPFGIKVIYPSGFMSGAVEDFVAAANAGGVTSGCIAFYASGWEITYNGVKITDSSLNIPVVNNYRYMSWSGNTITWESSKPSSMTKYISAFEALLKEFQPISE